jgi:predicted nucleic acid-binding Zn ribbon protein
MSKICQVCGSKFDPIRLDAKYCSNKCRQKKHRNSKRESSNKSMVLPLLMSDGSTLKEFVDQELMEFYSKRDIILLKDYFTYYDMYFLARCFGIEKEIFQMDCIELNTPEKVEGHKEATAKLKRIILEKWHRGTDDEKKGILKYYLKWALPGNSEIFDLFWNMYNS